AAQNCLSTLEAPSCVVVKHNNPCGVASADDLFEAVDRAIKSDPLSCFGGIVAVNQSIDEKMAKRLSELFLECVVAPEMSMTAREIFKKKKNQRVLISERSASSLVKDPRFTSIWGGVLIQTQDKVSLWDDSWQVLGET